MFTSLDFLVAFPTLDAVSAKLFLPLDLLRCHTVQPGKGDSGNSVLYIHFHGHAQLYVGDADIGTDKVEENFATSDADVLRIKVGTSS